MTTFVFTSDGPGTIMADVPMIATTNDTAAPVTEDELAEVERLDAQATPPPWDAVYEDGGDIVIAVTATNEGNPASAEDYAFMRRARTLLPRLARDLRTIDTLIDEAGIGRRGPEDTILDRLRRLIADANTEGERTIAAAEDFDTLRAAIERVTGRSGTAEQLAADLAATVEALAKKIADKDEDRLVSRDHQRLENRIVRTEKERDAARAVAAQAEALMQDREKMWRDIRDLIAAISPIRDGAPLTKEARGRIDNAIAQAMRRPGTSTDEGDRTT